MKTFGSFCVYSGNLIPRSSEFCSQGIGNQPILFRIKIVNIGRQCEKHILVVNIVQILSGYETKMLPIDLSAERSCKMRGNFSIVITKLRSIVQVCRAADNSAIMSLEWM